MQPSELPLEEKLILARTMAQRTDMTVTEIARQLAAPRTSVARWLVTSRGPQKRIPYGLAAGSRKYNKEMREAGISLEERIRVLQELRNAA